MCVAEITLVCGSQLMAAFSIKLENHYMFSC